MRTTEAAEPQVAIILTWQRPAVVAAARRRWDGITICDASAWSWRAIAVTAGELAETDIVPWTGAGDANRGAGGGG